MPSSFSFIILSPVDSAVVDVLQTYHCGTVGSLWLGTITKDALTEVGRQRQASTCFGVAVKCCFFDITKVTVLNCLGFFVYFLYPTVVGQNIRYCVTTEN